MTKKFIVVMLLMGITQAIFAQTNSDLLFELPSDFGRKSFYVELGQGNLMQVDLMSPEDIDRLANLDGILAGFLVAIEPIRDSLADQLTSKRIDYLLDSSASRKLRLQKFPPKGSVFNIDSKETSLLKLEQDTINFIGDVRFIADPGFRKPFHDERKFRVRFIVNDVSDLKKYAGLLNPKIATVKSSTTKAWTLVEKNIYGIKTDPFIRSHLPGGYLHGREYLYFKISINLTNYKNHFVPSFSLGAGSILSTHGFFKRDIFVSWEPNFLFAADATGSLRAYRNDFLTVAFGQGPIRDKDPRKPSPFLTTLSISYLVHRQGELVDKRSFRFGAGGLSLFESKMHIEPGFYFTDLFRHLTPCIRLTESF